MNSQEIKLQRQIENVEREMNQLAEKSKRIKYRYDLLKSLLEALKVDLQTVQDGTRRSSELNSKKILRKLNPPPEQSQSVKRMNL